MDKYDYLNVRKGKLSKGKITLKAKDSMVSNIIYCYNQFTDKDKLLDFYCTTLYGVRKEDNLIRQISSNLLPKDDYVGIIMFNDIFTAIISYEKETGKSITKEYLMEYFDDIIGERYSNFIKRYNIK